MATDGVGNLLMRIPTRRLPTESASDSRCIFNCPNQLAISADLGASDDVGGTVSYRTIAFLFSGMGNHFCAVIFSFYSFAQPFGEKRHQHV